MGFFVLFSRYSPPEKLPPDVSSRTMISLVVVGPRRESRGSFDSHRGLCCWSTLIYGIHRPFLTFFKPYGNSGGVVRQCVSCIAASLPIRAPRASITVLRQGVPGAGFWISHIRFLTYQCAVFKVSYCEVLQLLFGPSGGKLGVGYMFEAAAFRRDFLCGSSYLPWEKMEDGSSRGKVVFATGLLSVH